MDQNRLAQIALNFIPGVGHMLVKQLVSYCGSADAVLKAPKSKLLKIPGIGQQTATAIINQKPLQKAEEELAICNKHGIKLLLFTDPEFPKRLNQLNDAPSLLYYDGKSDLNASKVVAIVGTRKATAYGKEMTEALIEQLKPHNPIIISGLAYGIDICAHKAALKNNLETVGVLASGVNVIYPAIHKDVAHKMVQQGGLLSENPIDSKPDAPKFPARNRIIAGMADAVIIVEAALRGGALITAEIANSYNKDVFAVPGPLNGEYSAGCNNLIKINKANLLTSVKDLEYIMNWEAGEQPVEKFSLDLESLEYDERKVVNELINQKESIMIDNLSWQTQLPISKLASVLLNLEFKGYVNSLPGKRYNLTAKK
jgi:DNA processing protein